MKAVTAADVAELAGVSSATVSRYINGLHVRSAERVRDAIAQLEFRPNDAARVLKSGRTNTIAFVADDPTNPLIVRGLQSINTSLRGTRYRALLYIADPTQVGRTVLDLAGRVDGVIISPGSFNDPAPVALQQAGVEVVLLSTDIEQAESFDRVLIDNYGGARLAVDYLVKLGHRRIAAVHNAPGTGVGAGRAEGFRDALREHGIDLPTEYENSPDLSVQSPRQSGYRQMLRLLTLPTPPTAIFASAMLLTFGALHAVKDVHLQMPQDISVVGFDDHELFDIFSPGVTVVARDAEAQAEQALRMLLNRIDGLSANQGQRIILGTELIVRGSSATIQPAP